MKLVRDALRAQEVGEGTHTRRGLVAPRNPESADDKAPEVALVALR